MGSPLGVTFLGTGAADWPSEYAATVESAARGKVRGTASILVNGHLLIDCGGTVPEAICLFGADPGQITDLFLTHTHEDHLNADAVKRLLEARGDAPQLRLWVEAGGRARVPDLGGLDVRTLNVGETATAGPVTVTALAANHVVAGSEQPLHFLLERGAATMLYATDGAWLFRKTWLALRERELDLIVWDATNGDTQGDWRIFEHNSVDMIRVMRQTLRREGILPDRGRVVLTHMAQTLCAPHEEMSASLEAEGLVPAHDGLRIDVGS